MKQQRFTTEQWKGFIEQWKSSGLSAARYCRENKLPLANFYKRRSEIEFPAKKPSPFVLMNPVESREPDNSSIMVHVAGVMLEFNHNTDPGLFKSAVETMRGLL